MHADMTGDMIACQLALNHFVVLFVQNNSQMPRFSSFKNVFLPNRGKKVTHRVFESRNNFRLLFYHEFFAFIALVTRNCRPKSEAFTFYDTNLPIRSDKSRKSRQGKQKEGGERKFISCQATKKIWESVSTNWISDIFYSTRGQSFDKDTCEMIFF